MTKSMVNNPLLYDEHNNPSCHGQVSLSRRVNFESRKAGTLLDSLKALKLQHFGFEASQLKAAVRALWLFSGSAKLLGCALGRLGFRASSAPRGWGFRAF